MGAVRNVLFIMCDQLRADYLSCMGHRTLQTPHIDALAADGVTFDRAYVQSPICGPSRMSYYTGRYTFSHGSTWNNVPLSVAEWTMGDYLRPLGVRTALAGKTHMAADLEAMARLQINPASELGIPLSECGFEPFVRDDGLHPTGFEDPDLAYNAYLRDLGASPDHEEVRREMHERLFTWMRKLRTRTTVSDARVAGAAGRAAEHGILIGVW
jgi:arylsulfatase A-like enzyme